VVRKAHWERKGGQQGPTEVVKVIELHIAKWQDELGQERGEEGKGREGRRMTHCITSKKECG
jgi:hypothetical protein